jgi:RNA polymerase sigma-70 factor (ECF subfamily)
MTDQALLEQARKRDEAAFLALYQSLRDPLLRFAYRLTGSGALAEDLVHDSFVGLFRGGYDERRGRVSTYLYAAVRNLARKHYGDYSREDLTDNFAEARMETAEPLEALLACEISEAVQGTVAALPILQREALILFEYEELPLEEIARIVDADLSAVKSRLHRARERLRKSLAPTARGIVG